MDVADVACERRGVSADPIEAAAALPETDARSGILDGLEDRGLERAPAFDDGHRDCDFQRSQRGCNVVSVGGKQQEMNMLGHDDPCVQLEGVAFAHLSESACKYVANRGMAKQRETLKARKREEADSSVPSLHAFVHGGT